MKTSQCRRCKRDIGTHDRRRGYCDACRSVRFQEPLGVRRATCQTCGCCILHRHLGPVRFCEECSERRRKHRSPQVKRNDNELARSITKHAVKIGFLPDATDFNCVDCKRRGRIKKAQCYDHRDYSKPLDVDPVCLICNSVRGKGVPFISPQMIETA